METCFRRPLFILGMAVASGIAVAFQMGGKAWLILFAVLIVPAVRGLCFASGRAEPGRGRRALLLILAGYLAGGGLLVMEDHPRRELPDLAGESLTIIGEVNRVRAAGDEAGGRKLLLEVEAERILMKRGEKNLSGEKVMVTAAEGLLKGGGQGTLPGKGEGGSTQMSPGEKIRVSGVLKLPSEKRNPGCFDYRLYLRTKGINTTLYASALKREGAGASGGISRLSSVLFIQKESFLHRLEIRMSRQSALLMRGILFGETGELDEELLETFRRNGTAHILAVSGLHIGILYAALLGLVKLLQGIFPCLLSRPGRAAFFLLTLSFFLGYGMLSSWSPSVVRAVVMVLLHAFAQMTGRRYDLASAAFAVALASMCRQPLILFQAGFQMSFLAVLTLSLLTAYIQRIYSGVFLASLAVQLGLGPYMSWQFHTISLLAVFINVPVVFLAGLIVPLGVASMTLPGAGYVLDGPVALLCRLLTECNDLCRMDGITTFLVPGPPLWAVLLFYGGLVLFASEEGRLAISRRGRRWVIPAGLCLCLAAGGLHAAADDGFSRMDLVFVDVGQGDCIHVKTGGKNYLIDGGGSERYNIGRKTLRPYLLANGTARVDGAFVTHLHTDHYRGICELAREGMVRRIFVYEANRLKEEQITEDTGLKAEQITYLRRGHRVRLSSSASLTVLWPEEKDEEEYGRMIADEADENASSLIMSLEINGMSLLATGDLGEEGERELLSEYGYGNGQGPGNEKDPGKGGDSGKGEAPGNEKDPGQGGESGLRTDILKVGHHGSGYSSCEDFLKAVNPSLAVIQVGENNTYGHPASQTLSRLDRQGIPVLRNDLQGAIGMKIRSGKIAGLRWMIEAPAE